jgi:uncharacterized protein YutE (UPF0331/DUF86 family)
VVDEAVQAAKIAAVTDAVQRIRSVLPASPEILRADRTAREVIVLNLFVAIQECLALATHWLADAGRTVPSSYSDVFLALAEDRIIDRQLAQRLIAAAGFRNLVAHQYGIIDTTRLFAIASEDLDDLLDFCRALARHARRGSSGAGHT